MRKSIFLALALLGLSSGASAQLADEKAGPANTAFTGPFGLFPRAVPGIAPGAGTVTYTTGQVREGGGLIATLPFVYERPIQTTQPVHRHLYGVKGEVVVPSGAYGFLYGGSADKPDLMCLFEAGGGLSQTCYAQRFTFKTDGDAYGREAVIQSPFPSRYLVDSKSWVYYAWPSYTEGVTPPGDFALTVHFSYWVDGGAKIDWKYKGFKVYSQLVKPTVKGEPIRLAFSEGTLKITRDPSDKKMVVVEFEPILTQ